MLRFTVEHATRSVEPLNENSKGGETPLCDILIGGRVECSALEVAWFIDSAEKPPIRENSG